MNAHEHARNRLQLYGPGVAVILAAIALALWGSTAAMAEDHRDPAPTSYFLGSSERVPTEESIFGAVSGVPYTGEFWPPSEPPGPGPWGRCYRCEVACAYLYRGYYCCSWLWIICTNEDACPPGYSEDLPACSPGCHGGGGGGGGGGSHSWDYHGQGGLGLRTGPAVDGLQPQEVWGQESPNSSELFVLSPASPNGDALSQHQAALTFLATQPANLIVCPDESAHFATLEEAVQFSNAGDIIEFCTQMFIGPDGRDGGLRCRVVVSEPGDTASLLYLYYSEPVTSPEVEPPTEPTETPAAPEN